MKAIYNQFEISSKLLNKGVTFPNSSLNLQHNKFKITVKNTELNKRCYFDFYDSNQNFKDNIKELDNNALLSAFGCFISDSVAGCMTQDDFIDEFGYDWYTGRKIHNLCQKSFAKFEKICDDDIYDFSNDLNEFING